MSFLTPSPKESFPYRETRLKGEPLFYKDGNVDEIKKPEENIVLVRTNVDGNVAGRTVKVHRGAISGNISSEDGIWVNKHTLRNDLKTKGSIQARFSDIERAIAAGSITIDNCPYVGDALAKDGLKIHKSVVFNATAEGGKVEVVESDIKLLRCPASIIPYIEKCNIEVLEITRDNTDQPTTCLEEKSKQKNLLKVKPPTITLIDTIVEQVFFENNEGGVNLIGKKSRVNMINGRTVKKINGKIPQQIRLHSPKAYSS